MWLGMMGEPLSMTQLNTALDELLPTLSDDEFCTFVLNLSNAYAKCKQWEAVHKKYKIDLEVDEREHKKLKKALAERDSQGKKRSSRKLKTAEDQTSSNPPAKKTSGAVIYDSNPSINKAIREFVGITGSYEKAVILMKSLGALDMNYALREDLMK